VSQLAAEFKIALTKGEVSKAYELRSKLVHTENFLAGLGNILSQSEHSPLYEKIEAILRATVRRCLADEQFGDFFKDDAAVEVRWPLGAAMPTLDEKTEFLQKDLLNSLRWLFVNAVVWHASAKERLTAMYTCFVEARALYEFYFSKHTTQSDDARAKHFADSWTEPESALYVKYMASHRPAQKRLFHLVYGRSKPENAGGPGQEGSDHLKNQVLDVAKDLRKITERFVVSVRSEFRDFAQAALDKALGEAGEKAREYGITNPL
jgi:hypothetical protein